METKLTLRGYDHSCGECLGQYFELTTRKGGSGIISRVTFGTVKGNMFHYNLRSDACAIVLETTCKRATKKAIQRQHKKAEDLILDGWAMSLAQHQLRRQAEDRKA